MKRTVIQVRVGGKDNSFVIWLSEPKVQGSDRWAEFVYSADDLIPREFRAGLRGVDEIGVYIWERLRNHTALKDCIETMLNAATEDTEPVIVCISPESESFPWEALQADGSFLALDRRWPIARMSLQAPGDDRARNFEPPLKILAVLAADKIDAADEWARILGSLNNAAFPVDVMALVADQSLYDTIAATDSAVVSASVDYVPSEVSALAGMIKDYKPNVLHFFCHGVAIGGTPYLQVATPLSIEDGGRSLGGRPLHVAAVSLPTSTLRDSLWLVTLNCCGSAQPVEATGSLALSLASSGVPAVAGMREPVSGQDASAFSGGFYRAVVDLLAGAATAGRSTEIDWTTTLYETRMELCEAHRGEAPWQVAAPSTPQWTLPVLYVGAGQFTLHGRLPRAPSAPEGARALRRALSRVIDRVRQPRAGPPLDDAERASIETQLQIFRDLVARGPDAPDEVFERYQARIRELERMLYGRR